MYYKKINIKIASITETKKKLQGTKDTKNYSVIYSGVKQNIRAQSGVMMWIHKSISKTVEYYKFWNDRIIEVRLKINRGYMTVLAIYAPEEGRREESEEFYQKLQEIVDKINKNDYVLLMGDFNARIGKQRVDKVIGTNGESTVNVNGKMLTDFCLFNEYRIMNSFFKHKDIHKFTWHGRDTKSIIDYTISNGKMVNIIKDVRTYRGAELDTDHYLLITRLSFPPRWKNTHNSNQQKNRAEEKYKIRLLNDQSTRWLYAKRIDYYLQKKEESIDVEEEWENLKQILKSAAEESLGKLRPNCKRKYLKIWDEEMKNLIKEKKEAYNKWLNNKTMADKINYKRLVAIVRRESRKRKRMSWERFVSHIEHDLYRTRPNTYKILKHLNQDIRESGSLILTDSPAILRTCGMTKISHNKNVNWKVMKIMK